MKELACIVSSEAGAQIISETDIGLVGKVDALAEVDVFPRIGA